MAKPRKLPASKPTRHYIREWRKRRKLTQEKLAEHIDKTHGAISQLERGLIDYTQGTLESLATALDVNPGDLLNVDPTKEGQVAEIASKLRRATPEQQRQVLALVNSMVPPTAEK